MQAVHHDLHGMMYALYKSIGYVIGENIPGDIVECGTWKGGSCMLCAFALQELGHTERKLWLYDTFEGMSLPTPADVRYDGRDAAAVWRNEHGGHKWCYAPLGEVRKNMLSTGYPPDNIEFVKGKVEDTLTRTVPQKISILRLDTDWYESTLLELNVLFPLLVEGGVLLLDDYGYWLGSKKAVDEYVQENGIRALLVRLDHSGRIALKNPPSVKESS